MNYFIHEGQAQKGPFSYDDLKTIQIQLSTPVWREGLDSWVKASELPELAGLFTSVPPPYSPTCSQSTVSSESQPSSAVGKVGFRIGKSLGVGGILVLLFLIGLYFHNRSINPPFGSAFPSSPYVDPEHSHPDWFLNTQGTYKQNFWGNKDEISGSITNKATHTNYKDVRVKVEFLSQTKSVISSQEYIIYQYVPYGSTQNFSLSLPKPAAAVSVGLGVVSATYY